MSQIVKHPLDGAYARYDRAEEHLSELKQTIADFIQQEYRLTREIRERDPHPPPMGFERPGSAIPPIIPILVGETIYNLRACLDYLVYELAILDSGTMQNGTQFPIEDTSQGFKGRQKSYLKGINTAHTEAIGRLQPHNGVEWTRRLRTISNPDKHRYLIVSEHGVEHTMKTSPDLTDLLIFNDAGFFITYGIPLPSGDTMYIQFHFTYFIAFNDGLRVIETLEEIKTEVDNTLADFKPKF